MKIKGWFKGFTFGFIGTFVMLSGYLMSITVKEMIREKENKKEKDKNE